MSEEEKSKLEIINELKESKKIIFELETKLRNCEETEKYLTHDKHVLQQTKDELERIIESSPAAIIVFDLNGTIRRWSPAAEIMFGWVEEEVIGIFNPIIPLEYMDSFQEQLEFLRAGKTYPTPYEIEIIIKNGSSMHVNLSVAPFHDLSGNVDGAVSVLTDLTEFKEAEAKLQKSENRYKAIFETTGAATIIFDKEGIITSQNAQMGNISGYSKEEIEGKRSWMEFLPHEELEMMLKYHKKRIKNPKSVPEQYESRFITKDGTVNMIITVDQIPGSDEYISSLVNITDLRNAEKRLKKSLEEKEMLMKEIHHRVKNNLMIMSSLLNIQSTYIEDQDARDVFRKSQNRAKSMAIIHEKLYGSVDPKNIDFGDYIHSLTTELYQTMVADSKLVKLILNVEDVMIDINTAVPLGLIVNELVTNCMKYAFPNGESGEICVEFYHKDDSVILKVSDDGLGFPEDLDFKNTKSLGLQLINSLTSQIDGELTLDTTHGTEFAIRFKDLNMENDFYIAF